MILEQALNEIFTLDIPYLPTFPRGYFLSNLDAASRCFEVESPESLCVRSYGAGEDILQSWNPETPEAAWTTFLDYCRRRLPRCVKLQIVGPVTLYRVWGNTPRFWEVIRNLRKKIQGQLIALQNLSIQPIIFLDEPVLGLGGTGIDFSPIGKVLAELFSFIQQSGALCGLHSCAPGPFPGLFNFVFDYFSFDVRLAWKSIMADQQFWSRWLKQGGRFALGCVSTSGMSVWPPRDYKRKFMQAFGEEGEIFFRESLLTPACGLGTRTSQESKGVWRKVLELRAGLQEIR